MTAPDTHRAIVIYTDGGADPNPGIGGWGVVLLGPDSDPREFSGNQPATTNNRMELTAAIRGLQQTSDGSVVEVFTDSQYVRQGITKWLPGWVKRGWQRKDGEIKNVDLWRELHAETKRRSVRWTWVKGHSGNRWNERADQLATAAIRGLQGVAVATAVTPTTDVTIFQRVSASGRDGAWAALVRSGAGDEETRTGVAWDQSPNRLDLVAVCTLLEGLGDRTSVAVLTPSDYLRNGASQWLLNWQKRDWVTKEGSPVKNADLWKRLTIQLSRLRVEWPAPDRNAAEWKVLETALRGALGA